MMIKVGQGSKSYDFFEDLNMGFLTFFLVNGWMDRIRGGA